MINAMLWGDLAMKADVWNQYTVVDIASALVNMKRGRIVFSQVLLSPLSDLSKCQTFLSAVQRNSIAGAKQMHIQASI